MICLIAAISENNVLGMAGKLPWHLPADFAWFKSQTLGKPMIMGRKTFDSFGGKPLPKRLHIVISRTPQPNTDQVIWVLSVEDAITEAKKHTAGEIMVIGGGEIYAQSLPLADRLYLTEIAARYEGDAFFPVFEKSAWQKTILAEHGPENGQPAFTITRYERIDA
jgi:dihydrofolate reductase